MLGPTRVMGLTKDRCGARRRTRKNPQAEARVFENAQNPGQLARPQTGCQTDSREFCSGHKAGHTPGLIWEVEREHEGAKSGSAAASGQDHRDKLSETKRDTALNLTSKILAIHP